MNINDLLEKLLQGKKFNKRICFNDSDLSSFIEQIRSVQDLPLKNIALGSVATAAIPTVAAALKKLSPHLQKLEIMGGRMSLEGGLIVANLIQNSKLLQLKIMRGASMDYNSDGILAVINSMQQSSLCCLKLCSLDIGDDVRCAIIGAIKGSQLTKLCLDRCIFRSDTLKSNVGSPMVSSIINSINASSLQTLKIFRYRFTDAEMVALFHCVENSSLTKLHLIGDLAPEKKCALMKSILASNITNLSLGNHNFHGNCAEISAHIEKIHVRKLSFANSYFYNEELIMIVNSIKNNAAIESITFCSLIISDTNVDTICDLLEGSNIKSINLICCALRDSELIKLVDSIKRSSVVSLNLRGNYIGLIGTMAICELLENHNLTKLNLNSNRLTDDIIRAMIASIKRSSLIKLNVDGNDRKINKTLKCEIKEILQEQRKIAQAAYRTKSARATICQ